MRHRFKIWTLLIALLLCAGVVYGTTVRDKMTFTGPVTLSGTTTISGTTNMTVVNATATAISVSGLLKPATAGGINIGTLALPFSGAYIGSSGSNNTRLTGTFTGQRTTTVPDANITVSGITAADCGTIATCSSITVATNGKLIFGSVALVGGTATISAISPAFTSTSTFICHVTSRSATFNVTAANVSVSSFSITSASDTDTSTVNWSCIGR